MSNQRAEKVKQWLLGEFWSDPDEDSEKEAERLADELLSLIEYGGEPRHAEGGMASDTALENRYPPTGDAEPVGWIGKDCLESLQLSITQEKSIVGYPYRGAIPLFLHPPQEQEREACLDALKVIAGPMFKSGETSKAIRNMKKMRAIAKAAILADGGDDDE